MITPRCWAQSGAVAAAALLAWGVTGAASAQGEPEANVLPPSPATILGHVLARTPPIDAAPLCTRWSVHESTEEILSRDGPAAALDAWKTDAAPPPPGAELLIAALETRLAVDDAALVQARVRLRRSLDAAAPPPARRCALLELARAELRLRRFPEAAARAREALREVGEGEEIPPTQRDAIQFLLAEAYVLGGRREKASGLFLELTRSGLGSVAAASRLRLADLRFARGRAASALPEYEVLLERGELFGAEPVAWAERAVEAAVAAGDFASALSWLERQPTATGPDRARVTVRYADLLAALGRRDESRDELEGVVASLPDDPIGALARVRVFDLGIEQEDPDEALEALRDVAEKSRHPGVSAYARLILARRLLARRDVEGSLPLLVRASYDMTSPSLVGEARRDLARAVDLAVERGKQGAGCSWLAQILDDHRTLVVNAAELPAASLALGRCYERLGLAMAALDVYRGMTRRFGASVADDVSLPIARASLAAGRLANARSAAEARVRQQGSPDRDWQLLLAEVRLEEGRHHDALELLAPLVQASAPRPAGPQLIRLLARAAHAAGADAAARRLLRSALDRQPPASSEGDALALAEAALLGADLHRRAGDPAAAIELYRLVLDERVPGALVAEAAYWLASLDGAGSAQALDLAAGLGDPPFARLARSRRAVDSTARRLGFGATAANRR